MTSALRAFAAHLRANIGVMLQYRGEILLWSIWGIVNPAVLYALWVAAAEGNETGEIAGLDPGGIAAYYFLLMIVGHMTGAWDVYTMGHYVRSGALSPLLLQPVLPIWKTLAENVAYKIATFMFVIPMWALFAWWVEPDLNANAWQLALGMLALGFGFALNYIMCYTVALMTFWVTKLDAAGEIYFGLGMMLGGRLAPLAALPEPIQTIARATPFRWMFAFPIEMLTGAIHTQKAALAGLAIQATWFAAVLVLFRFLWSLSVKRYTAVSG